MLENEKLIGLYKTMQTIRKVERKIEEEYKYDEMKTPIHLSIGQEAIAAGVCLHLRKDDYIFGTHRSHAQYIAKGGDLKKMIAEMYLRKTGCSLGRGGSMHLIDPEVGILGSTAIVGGNIPLGTGTALASKLQNNDKVTVIFFGDGAVDEGTFHESLNFALLKKLPVIYICENNHWAINSHQSQRHSGESIYRWADGYGIPSYQIDGNDVLKVSEYAENAVSRCRNGEGPTFIECITYRWKGHIGTVNDVGIGFRPQSEYDYWISKDPIKWYADYLKATGVLNDKMDESIDEEIDQLIDDAFTFAKNSPKPLPEELMDFVFAD
ncbi:thiamine pyrophosphate-dependent dehydrogenase E1 component subunit alpha [Desulfitobacterium sp.]|uniref:thiamine pyrophosphate-dependent dehydrogenase E1 component subunit alpha n=1 Tax=Desulfitobacterium sp. TaxID=49981 RepID=UPI002C35A7D4|nr:thiamine pyrophosphate-dependent dehydrogenase E1 component subunit alpha [Desulfitobacterium sp.]HVJ48140.1 thiamine pyrophosphate-dependent dehydrogenase E1 component subunit alpha [Desulfitobacterium sp.]